MSKTPFDKSCVYYFFPVIETESRIKINTSKKKYKTVYLSFFIKNELTNRYKLLEIVDRKNRFYLCENYSDLKIAEAETEVDVEIDSINSRIENHNTILLEFDNIQLTYLKDYLKTLNPRQYICTIIQFYKYLLQTLSLLVHSHIYHNHILFDSIVVNKDGHPLLSNFKFSIDYLRADVDTYLKHFILDYDPGFVEMPLEMHLVSYLLTNKLHSLSSYNIENVINEFISKNSILKVFGDSVVSSYKAEAIKYYRKYVNQPYEYILTDMLQYASTWDNYALSILFLRILIGLHHTINIKNKFIIYFMKLLVHNIHLVPSNRYPVEDTIRQFDLILKEMVPKDYSDIIENLIFTSRFSHSSTS